MSTTKLQLQSWEGPNYLTLEIELKRYLRHKLLKITELKLVYRIKRNKQGSYQSGVSHTKEIIRAGAKVHEARKL